MAEVASWARNLVRTWGGRGSSSPTVTRFVTAQGWRGRGGHSFQAEHMYTTNRCLKVVRVSTSLDRSSYSYNAITATATAPATGLGSTQRRHHSPLSDHSPSTGGEYEGQASDGIGWAHAIGWHGMGWDELRSHEVVGPGRDARLSVRPSACKANSFLGVGGAAAPAGPVSVARFSKLGRSLPRDAIRRSRPEISPWPARARLPLDKPVNAAGSLGGLGGFCLYSQGGRGGCRRCVCVCMCVYSYILVVLVVLVCADISSALPYERTMQPRGWGRPRATLTQRR